MPFFFWLLGTTVGVKSHQPPSELNPAVAGKIKYGILHTLLSTYLGCLHLKSDMVKGVLCFIW